MTTVNGGVYIDAAGNVFTVDRFADVVHEQLASTGQTVVVAGTGFGGYSGDGGPATSATLFGPTGITLDSKGNIFIADTSNYAVREVIAATGVIVTVAGNGTPGPSGDGGPATLASLESPTGLAIDSSGNLWIADGDRIREVTAGFGVPAAKIAPTSLTFSPAVTVGSSAPAQGFTVTNLGSAALNFASISIAGGNTGDFSQSNNCGASLAPGLSCTVNVTFTPTAGGTRASNVVITDNAPGSPQSILLTGIGADFSMSSSGSSSATVQAGQTATYQINFTSINGFTQTINLSCSGAPAHSTCSVPSSINLSSSGGSVTVTVTTTANTTASLEQPNILRGVALSASSMLSVPMLLLVIMRKRSRAQTGRHPLMLLLLGLVLLFPGCAAGAQNLVLQVLERRRAPTPLP